MMQYQIPPTSPENALNFPAPRSRCSGSGFQIVGDYSLGICEKDKHRAVVNEQLRDIGLNE